MFDFIFCIMFFVLGILIGLIGYNRTLSSNAITEANAYCAVNGDLKEIKISNNAMAVCGNGAVFDLNKPKGK